MLISFTISVSSLSLLSMNISQSFKLWSLFNLHILHLTTYTLPSIIAIYMLVNDKSIALVQTSMLYWNSTLNVQKVSTELFTFFHILLPTHKPNSLLLFLIFINCIMSPLSQETFLSTFLLLSYSQEIAVEFILSSPLPLLFFISSTLKK